MIDVNIEEVPDVDLKISFIGIKLTYKRYLVSMRGFSQIKSSFFTDEGGASSAEGKRIALIQLAGCARKALINKVASDLVDQSF